jgi:exosortase C (VPDSG-CTERM-specific)
MTHKSFRLVELLVVVAAIVGVFLVPLRDLLRLSLSDELYSYIPLIPLISGFLIWMDRRRLPTAYASSPGLAFYPLSAGLALLALYGVARRNGWAPELSDYLAVMVASLILLLAASCLFVLGKAVFRAIAFPAAFLFFAMPIPSGLHDLIERFLQHESADAADLLFWISGTPVFRQDLVFHLPGFSFQVAPECSGIHSTLVLFIIALLAGYLFLRSNVWRAVIVIVVLPIAIFRNGFRIFVVGQLCVHIGPEMINSYIHRHGGPIFFVLSLVPFGLCLAVLQRSELRKAAKIGSQEAVFTESAS